MTFTDRIATATPTDSPPERPIAHDATPTPTDPPQQHAVAPDAVATTTDPSQRRVVAHDGSEQLVFLETAAESGGSRTLLEADIAPGVRTPRHRHRRFSETFTVLSGTLTVDLGSERLQVRAGETVTAPVGVAHAFGNDSEERVQFRCALEPGSRGFEEAQQIVSGLTDEGRVRGNLPRDPRQIGLLVALMDTRFAGPMAALNPLFVLAGKLGGRQLATLRTRYVRW